MPGLATDEEIEGSPPPIPGFEGSDLDVETVLLPVSPVEAALGGFMTDVVAEARRRRMGVIGMKALGQRALLQAGLDARDLVRFAVAQDVDTVIIGCATLIK